MRNERPLGSFTVNDFTSARREAVSVKRSFGAPVFRPRTLVVVTCGMPVLEEPDPDPEPEPEPEPLELDVDGQPAIVNFADGVAVLSPF